MDPILPQSLRHSAFSIQHSAFSIQHPASLNHDNLRPFALATLNFVHLSPTAFLASSSTDINWHIFSLALPCLPQTKSLFSSTVCVKPLTSSDVESPDGTSPGMGSVQTLSPSRIRWM